MYCRPCIAAIMYCRPCPSIRKPLSRPRRARPELRRAARRARRRRRKPPGRWPGIGRAVWVGVGSARGGGGSRTAAGEPPDSRAALTRPRARRARAAGPPAHASQPAEGTPHGSVSPSLPLSVSPSPSLSLSLSLSLSHSPSSIDGHPRGGRMRTGPWSLPAVDSQPAACGGGPNRARLMPEQQGPPP